MRIVVSGAGAAGVAVTKLLLDVGVRDLVVLDSRGILGPGRPDLSGQKKVLAERTNPRHLAGGVTEALRDAEVFVGVSGGTLSEESLAGMAPSSVIFALANPTPEVDPALAQQYAAIVATGRSDFPNQINNVLAFPGIFRGALDAGARVITREMKIAAAHAIADLVVDPTAAEIVPSVFDDRVAPAVAAAVRSALPGAERVG